MDILKTAGDWARNETLASALFVLFGAAFLAASLGFWQMGKTDVARGYVMPMLVAGVLLVALGVGLVVSNGGRISAFEAAYAASASDAVAAEIARADQTLAGYRTAVFQAFPTIIAVCAILIPFLAGPLWRASLVTAIAMLTVIMLVDTGAIARLEAYREQLALAARSG